MCGNKGEEGIPVWTSWLSTLLPFAFASGESGVMDERWRRRLTGEGTSAGEYFMLLLIKDAPEAAPDCWSFTCWTEFDHRGLQ